MTAASAEHPKLVVRPDSGINSLAAGITDACEGPVTAMADSIAACLQALDLGILAGAGRQQDDGGILQFGVGADLRRALVAKIPVMITPTIPPMP